MGRNNKNRKAAKKQKEAQAAANPKQEETKQEASVSLKDQGNKAFIEHNYTTAEQLFTQAIQEDPKNHVCFSNRSATFCALKNYDKALEDAEMVIKLQPDWPKGYFRKGNALEQLLRYAEANQTYNLGLKVFFLLLQRSTEHFDYGDFPPFLLLRKTLLMLPCCRQVNPWQRSLLN